MYRDFLEDVKYSIPEKVASLIGQAFDCLDTDCKGCLSVKKLVECYNEKQHPHCLTRRKSPENVRAEFRSAIERKADQNCMVTKEAFIDYYAELNFCIPLENSNVLILTFSFSNNLS